MEEERERTGLPILSLNSVYPTTSYSSTPGRSAIAWVDAESMILHRLIISWVCNHLIKLRRTQGNGTLSHRLCNVRDYWITEILASSWFYYILTSWKKRQCHLGFFGEIDDLWEADQSICIQDEVVMVELYPIWLLLYPFKRKFASLQKQSLIGLKHTEITPFSHPITRVANAASRIILFI